MARKTKVAMCLAHAWVFGSRWNVTSSVSGWRSSAGKVFHSFGPATVKLLSPSRMFVRGMIGLQLHVSTSADRCLWRLELATSWQSYVAIMELSGTLSLIPQKVRWSTLVRLPRSCVEFLLNFSMIESVDKVKYLGVYFERNSGHSDIWQSFVKFFSQFNNIMAVLDKLCISVGTAWNGEPVTD